MGGQPPIPEEDEIQWEHFANIKAIDWNTYWIGRGPRVPPRRNLHERRMSGRRRNYDHRRRPAPMYVPRPDKYQEDVFDIDYFFSDNVLDEM